MAESVSFLPVVAELPSDEASVRAAVADPRLTRSNFFDGRLLTAEDLIREQVYLDGRVRELGAALGHGVARGLVPRLDGTRLSVSPGVAITPAGRALVVDGSHPVAVELGDRARLRQLNDGLYGRLPGGLYALVLGLAETTRGLAEAFPTDLSARRDTRPDSVVEGVELSLLRLDLPLPRGSALQARAQLAPEMCGTRPRGLGDDQVALGLLAVDADRVVWLDPLLCRHGLRSDGGPSQGPVALAEHWEALARELAAYRVSTGQAPSYAAREYLRLLPPAGVLPKAAIDPVLGTQQFFPGHWDVRLAPLRSDDWLALRSEALSQEPLDLNAAAPASVLVLALLDPSAFGAYAQALEAPRPNRAFPVLEGLRLRLAARTPSLPAQLDTDAETWRLLWPQVPEAGVVFVRRRPSAADGGVSALVLAQGTALPAPGAPQPEEPQPEEPQPEEPNTLDLVLELRVGEATKEAATRVRKQLERTPKRREPVVRCFLLLGARYDLPLWPTLAELLEREDRSSSDVMQLARAVDKLSQQDEVTLREQMVKLGRELKLSEKTIEAWGSPIS